MRLLNLFDGIGGFGLAAKWMGWDNVASCEIDPYCRRVLDYWFDYKYIYDDITTADFTPLRGNIDLVTGGFPCQPFSLAGKQRGEKDERYLWPHMLRAIREVRPRWAVCENVRGLLTQSGGVVFEQVCAGLEAAGYEVQPFILPAAGVGAPHRRDRLWIVAHAADAGSESEQKRKDGVCPLVDVADAERGYRELRSDKEIRQKESREPKSCDNGGKRYASDATSQGLQKRIEIIGRQNEEENHSRMVSGYKRPLCERVVTDTERIGGNEVHYQVQPEQPDGERPYRVGGKRADSYSRCIGSSSCGACGEAEGSRGGNNAEQEERGEPSERHNGLPALQRYASDTDGDRRRNGEVQHEYREEREAAADNRHDGKDGNADNAVGVGRNKDEVLAEIHVERERNCESNATGGRQYAWRNFPSQSPVCRGDDGLSGRLVGITFPKWREQAIKMFGNSVVPQVVYQIYKAIEEYENRID